MHVHISDMGSMSDLFEQGRLDQPCHSLRNDHPTNTVLCIQRVLTFSGEVKNLYSGGGHAMTASTGSEFPNTAVCLADV